MPVYANRALNLISTVIIPRTEHLRAAHQTNRRSIDHASRIGLRMEGSYAYGLLLNGLFACGQNLKEIERETEAGIAHARQNGLPHRVDYLKVNRGLYLALQGRTAEVGSIATPDFDTEAYEAALRTAPDGAAGWYCYHLRRLQARCHALDFTRAVAEADSLEKYLWIEALFIDEAEYRFYAALAYAAHAGSQPAEREPDTCGGAPSARSGSSTSSTRRCAIGPARALPEGWSTPQPSSSTSRRSSGRCRPSRWSSTSTL
jgi:hypothetical protein